MNIKSFWRVWAKALGEKSGNNDRESDIIASIRTFIFVSYLVTNSFIISGVIRHWNNANNPHTDCKEVMTFGSKVVLDCDR